MMRKISALLMGILASALIACGSNSGSTSGSVVEATSGSASESESESTSESALDKDAVNVEVVEITTENWQDYFTCEEFLHIRYDNFGTAEKIFPSFTLILNDKYAVPTSEEITEAGYNEEDYDHPNYVYVDYTINYDWYTGEEDLENCTFNYGRSAADICEEASEKGSAFLTETETRSDPNGKIKIGQAGDLLSERVRNTYHDIVYYPKWDITSFKVNRIKGTILIKPAEITTE
jgi:hypothetical protein